MIGVISALILSLAWGWLIIHFVNPRWFSSGINCWGSLGLIIGLGFGFSSLLYFCKLLFGLSNQELIIGEIVLIIIFTVILYKSRKGQYVYPGNSDKEGDDKSPKFVLLTLVGGLVGVFTLAGFVIHTLNRPFGHWDARSIWNLKALFFFRLSPENWVTGISDQLIELTHPDYPLLIPSLIARSWGFAGAEIWCVPALIHLISLFGIVLVVGGIIQFLKNKVTALFAILVLLSSSFLIRHGANQYADVAVGYFWLCALALFTMYDRSGKSNNSYLYLAGVLASLSAWTKNEGFIFLLCVLVARGISLIRHGGFSEYFNELKWFAWGALPVLVIIFYFKIILVPQNDLIGKIAFADTLNFLMDWERYWLVIKYVIIDFFKLFKGLVVILPLMWICFREPGGGEKALNMEFLVLVILFVLLCFCAVFLITPHGLEWHLHSTMRRLLLQLYPAIIFTVFVSISISEDMIPSWLKQFRSMGN